MAKTNHFQVFFNSSMCVLYLYICPIKFIFRPNIFLIKYLLFFEFLFTQYTYSFVIYLLLPTAQAGSVFYPIVVQG